MKTSREEAKQIILVSSIVCGISFLLSILALIFIQASLWTWSFSIILGHLASVFCYIKTGWAFDEMVTSSHPKGVMVRNYTVNMLIYTIVLVISQYFSFLNIFFCLFGILIERIVIVILFGIIPARKDGDKK
jgi:hypothetical protein